MRGGFTASPACRTRSRRSTRRQRSNGSASKSPARLAAASTRSLRSRAGDAACNPATSQRSRARAPSRSPTTATRWRRVGCVRCAQRGRAVARRLHLPLRRPELPGRRRPPADGRRRCRRARSPDRCGDEEKLAHRASLDALRARSGAHRAPARGAGNLRSDAASSNFYKRKRARPRRFGPREPAAARRRRLCRAARRRARRHGRCVRERSRAAHERREERRRGRRRSRLHRPGDRRWRVRAGAARSPAFALRRAALDQSRAHLGDRRRYARRGATADVTIFARRDWIVDPAAFASKGKSTPFAGRKLPRKVLATIVGGELRYRAREIAV